MMYKIEVQNGAYAKYRKDMQQCYQECGNALPTAAQLLDYAKENPKRPIYNYFEWDNDKASESWRRHQAVALIGGFRVNVVDVSGSHVNGKNGVREYRPVTYAVNGKERRGFKHITEIANDKALVAQIYERNKRILQGVLDEVMVYSEKYNVAEIEHGLVAAINGLDKLSKQLRKVAPLTKKAATRKSTKKKIA